MKAKLIKICILLLAMLALILLFVVSYYQRKSSRLEQQITDMSQELESERAAHKAADESIVNMIRRMEEYRHELSLRVQGLEALRRENPIVNDWCVQPLPDELLCHINGTSHDTTSTFNRLHTSGNTPNNH